jgi:23S rRNA (uracil1939-C5)-methyltransferase
VETHRSETREARVERLTISGDGMAEGGLRVPGALPGERIRGVVEDGVLVPTDILEASRERVAPPCPHAGACGGCVLQHATDGFVAAWKRSVVERALAARGLAVALAPVVTVPPATRRRAVLAARRTKRTVLLGFHGRRSDTLVDTPHCLVLAPAITEARPALTSLVTVAAARGGGLRLTVTAGPAGLDVDLAGSKPLDADLRMRLASVAEASDLARLSLDGEPVARRRPPFHLLGRARVVPPPGAFLQPTAEGEAALVAEVRAAVGGAARIADLFAGCGTFALPLAEAAEVQAVEGAAPMLEALDAGWRGAQGLRRVTTEARDLFRRPLLPEELARHDAVVLDPPRAGAEAQARALAASAVPRIAMVSCNPVSFARDAAILAAGGYHLERVAIIDQFRWSAHVELVGHFRR